MIIFVLKKYPKFVKLRSFIKTFFKNAKNIEKIQMYSKKLINSFVI